MMRIYRYETRIRFMLFRLQYWEKFEQLRTSLGVVLEATDALRHSKALKQLLQLILVLGNYMNSTGQQGGAFGMKIDSINKLTDTKASNESQMTLLHCLVNIVRRHFPEILVFLDDLKDVNQAAHGKNLLKIDVFISCNFSSISHGQYYRYRSAIHRNASRS